MLKKIKTIFKNREQNFNMHRSLLISYLILGVLLCTINTVFSGMLQKKLVKEYRNSYEYTISNFSDSFNQLINTFSVSTSQVLKNISDNRVHTVLKNEQFSSDDTVYFTTLFNNILNLNKSEICQVGIYFPATNTVLSERGYQSLTTYHTEHYLINDSSDEALQKALTDNSAYYMYKNSNNKYLYYKYHTTLDNADAIVFSCAKTQKYDQNIEKIYSSTNTNLVLYNKNSDIVLTDENFISEFHNFLDSGSAHYTTAISSFIPGWEVYVLSNEQFYASSIKKLNVLLVFVVLFAIIIAFILSIYFSNKHYLPIQGLVKNFNFIDNSDAKNEFAFIQRNIENLISKNNTYIGKILDNEQKDDLKSFLFGKTVKLSHETLFADDIKSNLWIVAIVKLTPLSAKRIYDANYTQIEIDTIFANIGCELIGQFYNVNIISIEKSYCFLINSPNLDIEQLKNIFEQIVKSINFYFNINFTICASNIERGYENLPALYKNAGEIMAVSEFLAAEQSQIKFYDSYISTDFDDLTSYISPQKLTQLIKQNLPEEIAAYINETIDATINNITSTNMLNEAIYRMLMQLTNTVEQIFAENDTLMPEKYNPLRNIFPYTSMNELKSNISEYLVKLCNYVVSKNSDIPLEQKIAAYIKTNYKNPQLDATVISDKFHIHSVHLSRIFKEYFNTGVHQYLSQIRINEAKKLLRETDKTVEEVGNEVGYNNIYSFSRAFKRITDFSPSQYRSSKKDPEK